MPATRVMVIDDSALMRQVLTRLLTQAGCDVVATASDPTLAVRKLTELQPDVITLDVEMPKVNGLEFLSRLMRHNPLPVVMVSSLTQRGADVTLRALELGAVDFVTKPAVDLSEGMEGLGRELAQKVKAAASSRVMRPAKQPAVAAAASVGPKPARKENLIQTTQQVICLGASTGGTEALKRVLTTFPASAPGTVIVQHMPEQFTRQFAERLDSLCAVRVAEARDGERVLSGHVYVAPGNRHLRIRRSGAEYTLHLSDEERVFHCRPAVDVLFESAASAVGPNAIAAVLTGMGEDGARGLKLMRDAGARTLAQDEASCVVYGMPKEAVDAGGVERVVSLDAMGPAILSHVRGTPRG
ncbi:MAG: chemotaxis response regulator protein-glutamate methylesterase [Archangium sp.]